jgi:hypothetical protein
MLTLLVFVASPPPTTCEAHDTEEFRERREGGRFGRLVAFVPDSILKMRRFEDTRIRKGARVDYDA